MMVGFMTTTGDDEVSSVEVGIAPLSTDNCAVCVFSSDTVPSAAAGVEVGAAAVTSVALLVAVKPAEEGDVAGEEEEGDVTPGTLLTVPSALMVGSAVATMLFPTLRWYIDITLTSVVTLRPAGVLHSTHSKPSARCR